MDAKLIRNFCIIAHIDHGKSTLADRMIQLTGAVDDRDMRDQLLDTMDLERERGITIKAQAVRLAYTARDGQTYQMNLIDTPGHVDFTYEVSRSLAACEGALLIVDAAQGVEAQTLNNVYQAVNADLEIIPVINKIDLASADVEETLRQIEEVVGLDTANAVMISAKTGEGVEQVMEAVVREVPPPKARASKPSRALIFDAKYDSFRGVVCYVRVMDGQIRKGQKIRMMALRRDHDVAELGVFSPPMTPCKELSGGEVGYVIAGIKTLQDVRVGDTITDARKPAERPLKGYQPSVPVVFAGFYPVDADDYEDLKNAIERLKLNDASFLCEAENSQALGFGFRCGFLGLLHMEVVQERLEREHGVSLITTAPSVVYRVHLQDGEMEDVDNPAHLPDPGTISHIEEPVIRATMILPAQYIGNVIKLCQSKRGVQVEMNYVGEKRAILIYDLPLGEVILDFYDRLKSCSQGYASFDYDFHGYQAAPIIKMDVLINGEVCDALSVMLHQDNAYPRGRALCEKLKELIPRQMFRVAVQAAIGGKIIARETVRPMRKDVTAKCYGGDVTRKRKLLEKQKAGKKRMRLVGKVEIPQEAFMAVLKVSE
jgi:GTP-binding protein LepA